MKWEDKVCTMLAETQATNLHYVQAHISASNDNMSARIDALIPNLMAEMKTFVGQPNNLTTGKRTRCDNFDSTHDGRVDDTQCEGVHLRGGVNPDLPRAPNIE